MGRIFVLLVSISIIAASLLIVLIADLVWVKRTNLLFKNKNKELLSNGLEFISKGEKEWNEYIDNLLLKSQSIEETEYILTHFKKFEI